MSADHNASPAASQTLPDDARPDASRVSPSSTGAAGEAWSWWTRPISWARGGAILGAGSLACLLLMPLDRWVMTTLGPFGGLTQRLGGDLRRELEFAQQFGAFTSMLIVGLVILLQDRPKAPRIADLVLAIVINVGVCNLLKVAFGRPRPRVVFGAMNERPPYEGFDATSSFAFFWHQFPLARDGDPNTPGVQLSYVWARSWEVSKGISSDLWSLPSSHAAAAACAAAALMRLYPRLTPLLVGLMLLVGIARVVFGAHYPSDVALGAALGYVVGAVVMERRWASDRLVAWLAKPGKHPGARSGSYAP